MKMNYNILILRDSRGSNFKPVETMSNYVTTRNYLGPKNLKYASVDCQNLKAIRTFQYRYELYLAWVEIGLTYT